MVTANAARVLAVEARAALQGLWLLRPLEPARALRPAVTLLDAAFPPVEADRFLQPEVERLAGWLLEGRLAAAAGAAAPLP